MIATQCSYCATIKSILLCVGTHILKLELWFFKLYNISATKLLLLSLNNLSKVQTPQVLTTEHLSRLILWHELLQYDPEFLLDLNNAIPTYAAFYARLALPASSMQILF